MKFLSKVKAATLLTNKEVINEISQLAYDLEDVVKEIRFQVNQAGRNYDANAQAFLDSIQANFFTIERILNKFEKSSLLK